MKNFTFIFLIISFAYLYSCSDSTSNTDPDAGRIVVEISTTGGDPVPKGYTVQLQGQGNTEADANDSVQFINLDGGTYQVELAGVAGHCTVQDENPKIAEVIPGETTTLAFSIFCNAILRNQLVFFGNHDRGMSMHKMNPDGTEVTRVLEYNVTGHWRPAISPDGTKIAFPTAGGGYETQQIIVVDADGQNDINITMDHQHHSEHPTWSPDGSQIAFHAYTPNGEGDIYIVNADGTGKTNITNTIHGDWWPSWSPDGETLAFHSTEPGSPVYISTIKTDGSGRTELLRSESVFFMNPSWSPDGSEIAFRSNLESEVSWEILIANADGSNPRSLTNVGIANIQHRFPTWSPDGARLAFDSNRDGNTGSYDIFVINKDGSGLVNITNNENETSIFPYWSPVE